MACKFMDKHVLWIANMECLHLSGLKSYEITHVSLLSCKINVFVMKNPRVYFFIARVIWEELLDSLNEHIK